MKTDTHYRYHVFKTPMGWFGLLGCDDGLVRTCLPVAFKEAAAQRILSGIGPAQPDKKAFKFLEQRILSYFKGEPVDFGDLPVCLNGLTAFQVKVLTTLRAVTYGKTVSYGQLARTIKNPKAARAIGTVMAGNPLPLIIPCHRVIKTDGSLGYFSAAGGVQTKQRLLELEKAL